MGVGSALGSPPHASHTNKKHIKLFERMVVDTTVVCVEVCCVTGALSFVDHRLLVVAYYMRPPGGDRPTWAGRVRSPPASHSLHGTRLRLGGVGRVHQRWPVPTPI